MIYVAYQKSLMASERSLEQYGDWSEDWHCYLLGICLNDDAQSMNSLQDVYATHYEKFPVEANKGDTLYVLSIWYSEGDSFGRSDGLMTIVYVFKSFDLAENAKRIILENEKEYTISFPVDSGKTFKFQNPGYCYFARINNVSVDKFVVQSTMNKYEEFISLLETLGDDIEVEQTRPVYRGGLYFINIVDRDYKKFLEVCYFPDTNTFGYDNGDKRKSIVFGQGYDKDELYDDPETLFSMIVSDLKKEK
jgi:hypothetical protein